MEHRAYPKIATRLPPGTISPGGTWVATEKIHGAQLVIATDGVSVRIGKRKAWLREDEPFFGWQLLRAELSSAAHLIHRAFGFKGIMRLFGEIFGGEYPHADVPAMPGASAVQTGIFYAPDIHFALFDVLIEIQGASEDVFLGHSELLQLAGQAGLKTPPFIGRGSRSDLDQLPVRFLSRVPAMLGLPSLPNNWAEGLVLKPDARLAPDERPVIKRKISEFDEQRFDESAPWNAETRLSIAALLGIAERMVNPPRVASARSKHGDASPDALRDEIVLDVLVDLEAAFPTAMRELGEPHEATLRHHLSDLAARALHLGGSTA